MKSKVDKKGGKRSFSETSVPKKLNQKEEDSNEFKKGAKRGKFANVKQNGHSASGEKASAPIKVVNKQKQEQNKAKQQSSNVVKSEQAKKDQKKKTDKTAVGKKSNKPKKKRRLNILSHDLSVEKIKEKIEEIRNRDQLSKRAKKILSVLNKKLQVSGEEVKKVNTVENKNNKKLLVRNILLSKQKANNRNKIKGEKKSVQKKIKEELQDEDDSEVDSDNEDSLDDESLSEETEVEESKKKLQKLVDSVTDKERIKSAKKVKKDDEEDEEDIDSDIDEEELESEMDEEELESLENEEEIESNEDEEEIESEDDEGQIESDDDDEDDDDEDDDDEDEDDEDEEDEDAENIKKFEKAMLELKRDNMQKKNKQEQNKGKQVQTKNKQEQNKNKQEQNKNKQEQNKRKQEQNKNKQEQNKNKQNSQTLNNQQKGNDEEKGIVLFVGNLPANITKKELQQYFLSKVNTVNKIKIPTNVNNKAQRGFAYVEVPNEAEFEKGLSLHNTLFKKKRIDVEFSIHANDKETTKKLLASNNAKLRAAVQKAAKMDG